MRFCILLKLVSLLTSKSIGCAWIRTCIALSLGKERNSYEKILPADTLTPILAYMRVQGDHKVILESIPREKENARFSIVAYNPVFEVTYQDGILYENGKVLEQDPFDYLHQVTVKGLTSDLPFAGGAIGFAGSI